MRIIRGAGNLRNSDASLARFATVDLDPDVMCGVIRDRGGIDGRPQDVSRPLADMRMNTTGNDEDGQVADVRQQDSPSPLTRLIAQGRECEDDDHRESRADRGQRVGADAVEPQRPRNHQNRAVLLSVMTEPLHDNGRRVRCQRRPS